MVIDTSVLIAMLTGEEETLRLARAIEQGVNRLLSAATHVEASIVIGSRLREGGLRDLDALLSKFEIAIVSTTKRHAEWARHGFMRYGKGRHEAGLNFSDCFSYALAKETGEPLLFKGTDFGLTDIEVCPY